MQEFTGAESTLIVAMIVGYILFTGWLTLKLRSTSSAQFMTAARSADSSGRRNMACFG